MLSRKAKYAINALVYLTRHRMEGPVQIGEIASAERIPQKFLEAILLDLRNAGILVSKKGKRGGYSLLKDPEDINLAEVMRLFDGPIALLPCVSYLYYQPCEECKDERICGIREVLIEVRNQTVELLKNATLNQIVRREFLLKEKLAEEAEPR